MSNEFKKGYDFQEHVKSLLVLSGYFEGQVYSTGVPLCIKKEDYQRRLEKAGIKAYTSPDIVVQNKWLNGPKVEMRYSIECKLQNKLWNSRYFTVKAYKKVNLEKVKKDKGLEIYLAFGKETGENIFERKYEIGIIKLDDFKKKDIIPGYSGKKYLYDVEALMSWEEFLMHRIDCGDREILPIEKLPKVPSVRFND